MTSSGAEALKPAFWESLSAHSHPLIWSEQGQSFSGQWLDSTLQTLAESLQRPTGLFALVADNSLGCLLSYLACLRARAPLILFDRHHDERVIASSLKLFGATRLPAVTGLPGQARFAEPIVQPRVKAITWHPDLALLLPTSGSSGAAQLVMLSYSNLQANAESIALALSLGEQDRAITSLSPAYSYGLSVINSHLQVGAGLVLSPHSLLDRRFWRHAEDCAVNTLAAVPLQYEMLERLNFRTQGPPFIHTLTQAGGRLPDTLQTAYTEWACAHGRRFFVMYGQTEATARIAVRAAHRQPDKIGSIGSVIPGGELWVEAMPERQRTAPGGAGELCYRGPNVMLGKARQIEDLACPARPAVLRTGDLGYVDDDGDFYIVGRLSRHIRIGGRRVDLDAIEKALQGYLPAVRATGEDERLIVAVASGAEPPLDLRGFVLEKLDFLRLLPAQLQVLTLADLPRTPSGKPDYPRLRALADAPA